jgi:hypothetical protein
VEEKKVRKKFDKSWWTLFGLTIKAGKISVLLSTVFCVQGGKTFSDTVLNNTTENKKFPIFRKNIYQYLIVQNYFFKFSEESTSTREQLIKTHN